MAKQTSYTTQQFEKSCPRDIYVGEDFRIAVTLTIEKFRLDEEQTGKSYRLTNWNKNMV